MHVASARLGDDCAGEVTLAGVVCARLRRDIVSSAQAMLATAATVQVAGRLGELGAGRLAALQASRKKRAKSWRRVATIAAGSEAHQADGRGGLTDAAGRSKGQSRDFVVVRSATRVDWLRGGRTQLLSYRRVLRAARTKFALGSTPCGGAAQRHKGTWEGEAVVGRERERATGGVLLFAEGAGGGQGCAPMTLQPRRAFRDAPAAQSWGCCSAARGHGALDDRVRLEPWSAVCSEQRRGLFAQSAARPVVLADKAKGEPPADVMVRRRRGQQQSGQPEGYAMCTGVLSPALASVAGERERAALSALPCPAGRWPEPTLAREKCTCHRQITVARCRKSRARSQRRVAAQSSPPALAADSLPARNCAGPQVCCTLRPSSSVLRDRKPQQQTASVLAETGLLYPSLSTANSAARRPHSGQTIARPSQSHKAHAAMSPPRSLALHALPQSLQGLCRAQLLPRCSAMPSAQSRASPRAAAPSRLRLRSIQRQHDAMQLRPRLRLRLRLHKASKLLIVMLGPARTWTRRVRVRRSEQDALCTQQMSQQHRAPLRTRTCVRQKPDARSSVDVVHPTQPLPCENQVCAPVLPGAAALRHPVHRLQPTAARPPASLVPAHRRANM
ncbi:hypothetical protein SVAN01_04265 [Stagonosporopsis vannaccii]|nr:hypothetical protein SVAN01_04265 [Stagonosporopsis vannaccii]